MLSLSTTNLVLNLKKAFFGKQNIFSAAAFLMFAVAVSRVLGLLRDRMLAASFGDGAVLGVYFAAFRLPDLVFQLLIMGSLSSAFIPVFSKLINEKKEDTAWNTANSSLTWALLIFSILALVIFIFARPLSTIIAPGFNSMERDLLASLTRVLIFAQIFFILSNFVTGVLQSTEHFFITAFAPVFYNVGIIIGIVFLSPAVGIYGPAWGVLIGTFLHFLVQLPFAALLGWRFRLSFKIKGTKVKEIIALTIPRIFGSAVSQIDYTFDVILASLISTSSLVYFNFAQHLQLLPIGLFGATIAQASLPKLSSLGEDVNLKSFKDKFLEIFHQLLFLTAPFQVILLVLRIPAVRLTFGAARFDWTATLNTAYTLTFFAISIVAQAAVYLLVRGFYALSDTKTPVRIGIVSVLINVVFSLVFTLALKMPVWGLAFACSIASIFNASLLLLFLDRKVGGFSRNDLLSPILKIGFSSFLMGIALYIPLKLLDEVVLDTTKVSGLLLLTGIVSISGFLVYGLVSYMLKVPQLRLIMRFLKKYGAFQSSEFYS